MDNKKLDRWAELLLDTGKRNNLINFKETKTSTAEILLPQAEDVLKKLEKSFALEVLDTKLIDHILEKKSDNKDTETNKKDDQSEETKGLSKKEKFIAKYGSEIKNQNQLLLYNSKVNALIALKNIDKRAREFIEETGVNVLYLAFGFINWKEHNNSESIYQAPVLLVPIQLNQESAIDPYIIQLLEDDVIVNPTFKYKLEGEYGITLPEYENEGLENYLNKIQKLVEKLQWTVTSECKIGIFSFLKINMYQDIKENTELILNNQNVRLLLGESIEEEIIDENNEASIHLIDPLIQLHSVVDADSSQIEAIEMAKSGKSFVLQGPPGTGKSQTITNIIAECLNDGKKVLFVSEKLAALNVVYEKLKQVGLSEFCLELHSHKANKRDIISDICETLRLDKSTVSSKAKDEISIKKKAKSQLDSYAYELHKQQPVIEKSLYQLYEDYSTFRLTPTIDWFIPQISLKDENYLLEASSLLEQYVNFIPSIGYNYKRNPWYGYKIQDMSSQMINDVRKDLISIIDFLEKLNPLMQEISNKFGIQCSNIKEAYFWYELFSFIANSDLITYQLLNYETFTKVKDSMPRLFGICSEILSLQSKIFSAYTESITNINGSEYYEKLNKQFRGIFSRIFNAEYKKLITDLTFHKKDHQKLSYNEAVEIAEKLYNYQSKLTDFYNIEISVKSYVGNDYKGINTDWNNVLEQLAVLENVFAKNIPLGEIGNYLNKYPEKKSIKYFSDQFEAIFKSFDDKTLNRFMDYFDHSIPDFYTTNSNKILERLKACLKEIRNLHNWNLFRKLLSELEVKQIKSFIDTVIQHNIEIKDIVNTFKRQFYFQWIEYILFDNPSLATFNRISQDQAIQTFVEKDTEQFEINKAQIREELSSKRPSLNIIAPGSSLSILLREEQKKRKQKSVRTLLTETGELIQRIKPCFLMSPLSVSTFLDPKTINFDVVIFDEASQIFPQDALGAIYRANQMIIVGDSKQMPPSNFFNSTIDIDDRDEETGDVTDFESILDLCSTSFQQLRLRWHYRSRYEQLIAFSNKNFYNGDLVTFPSSKIDAPWIGVDYYHVDGIFDRISHTNLKEAEFIVDLVYQNIERYPNRSLGVVAFSKAQQDLIDKLISQRRQELPEKEFFFKTDRSEPFFVKNLETVQGDERDTIIFSTAYGKDAQGRLLHNFGPLNREGGERRLNVAVTRAKHNVQLVSSMRHTDIDLNRTSSEGAKLLKEYLDYAENGSIALERSISLNQYEQFDSEFELEVCEFLRSKGFSVDTQVGCSGYRIDMALKKPESTDYLLAIECDGASYHSSKNARDRDRLRQEVLERMGWKFYRIWSTDWFKNKSIEQERLLDAVTKAIENSDQTNLKTIENSSVIDFEEIIQEENLKFPPYQTVDFNEISRLNNTNNFKYIVREILKTEAPLSEELLLKRALGFFGKEKVTKAVRDAYEQEMKGYDRYSIIRKNGFLYLKDKDQLQFRVPGDIKRDIKQIAPEELAAGMLEIINQNVVVDKSGLFRSLAAQCGITRVTKTISNVMDSALQTLDNQIKIDGEQISLK